LPLSCPEASGIQTVEGRGQAIDDTEGNAAEEGRCHRGWLHLSDSIPFLALTILNPVQEVGEGREETAAEHPCQATGPKASAAGSSITAGTEAGRRLGGRLRGRFFRTTASRGAGSDSASAATQIDEIGSRTLFTSQIHKVGPRHVIAPQVRPTRHCTGPLIEEIDQIRIRLLLRRFILRLVFTLDIEVIGTTLFPFHSRLLLIVIWQQQQRRLLKRKQ